MTSPDADEFDVAVIGPDGFDEAVLGRMACFFRHTFATAFGQYLFYPSQLAPIAPDAVLGTASPTLEQLDCLDLGGLRLPTGEAPRFWHDPGATLDNMRRKLPGRGHAVLCSRGGDMIGMTFAYACGLREAFAIEEWENPVTYSGHRPPRLRSFARFRDSIAVAMAAHPEHFAGVAAPDADTTVLVSNCVAVAPAARGRGLALRLTRRLAEALRTASPCAALYLAEVMPGGYWHRMMGRAAAVDMPGALGEGACAPRLLVASLVEHLRRLPGLCG